MLARLKYWWYWQQQVLAERLNDEMLHRISELPNVTVTIDKKRHRLDIARDGVVKYPRKIWKRDYMRAQWLVYK